MAFRVEIAPRAFNDLDEIAAYIKRRGSFESAEEWFNGIMDAIQTLEAMPSRSPIADESEDLGEELRVLLYGRRNCACCCTGDATAGTRFIIRSAIRALPRELSESFM